MNLKYEEIRSEFNSAYIEKVKLINFEEFDIPVILLSSQTELLQLKRPGLTGDCNFCNLLESDKNTYQSALKDKYIIADHIESVFQDVKLAVDRKHYRRKDIEKIKDMLSLVSIYKESVALCDGIAFPDGIKRHFNISLVNKGYFPLIEKIDLGEKLKSFYKDGKGEILLLEDKLRSAIVVKAEDYEWIFLVYLQIEKLLGRSYSLSKYPYLNCCSYLNKGNYTLVIFPRVVHKPMQYYDNSNLQIEVVPGIIELLGIFMVTDTLSYDNINKQSIKSIFEQISYSFTNLKDVLKPLIHDLNEGLFTG